MTKTFKLLVQVVCEYEIIYKIPAEIFDRYTSTTGGKNYGLVMTREPTMELIDLELFEKVNNEDISLGFFRAPKTLVHVDSFGNRCPTRSGTIVISEEQNDN